MKVSFHIAPSRRDFSSEKGMISGRESEQLDRIASAFEGNGIEARVVEAPIVEAADSDFWFVFADDIEWHLQSRPGVDREALTARMMLLNPSRDVAFDLLEAHGAAGAIAYDGAAAWEEAPKTGTVVRRDVAAALGGELGVGLPFFKVTDRYASWKATGHETLVEQVAAYLRAARDRLA